jgi:streptogramin lyase
LVCAPGDTCIVILAQARSFKETVLMSFASWLRGLKALVQRPAKKRAFRTLRPRFETLEDRCLLSINFSPVLASFSEFSVPTPNALPDVITAGPDGNVWFSEFDSGKIGRITPTGVVTEYCVGDPSPRWIVAGPDGNLWFTDGVGTDQPTNPQIVEMAPNGVVIQTISLPTGSDPSLTLGPDGNIWFSEYWNSAIGRITPNGCITQFPIPYPAANIVTGPDGNLWFDASFTNAIGSITPCGVVNTYTIQGTDLLRGITAADGELWLVAPNSSKIFSVNTAGQVTGCYATPTLDSGPYDIVAGPDGALWFTEPNVSQIGRITVGGSITEYPTPTPNSDPNQITLGPDGNLWFTESNSNQIGEIVFSDPQTQPLGAHPQIAYPNVAQTFNMGTFTDPGEAGPWTVQVDWGDQTSPSSFSVNSTGDLGSQAHTYASQGFYTATETVTDNQNGDFATTQFQVVVGPVVVNTSGEGGPGSLLQAINEVNTVSSLTDNGTVPADITFDIPTTDPGYNSATGTFLIQPQATLPAINEPVIIDGYSQPGASPNTLAVGDNAVLPIVLDGSQQTSSFGSALELEADNSTVRGLAMQNFNGFAIWLTGWNDVIQGNNITETAAAYYEPGSGYFGIVLADSPNALVGGVSPADRNVISGAIVANLAILAWAPPGTPGAIVEGNYIGTNAAGTEPAAIPGADGIEIGDDNNTIGGTGPGAGNLISGNTQYAVFFTDSWNGNNIGAPIVGNVIEGNLIGTDASGTDPVPNGAGIVLTNPVNITTNTTIGGSIPGAGNTIAFNNGPGVWVAGDSTYVNPYSTGVQINGNSIYDNAGLGIDLGDTQIPDGVNSNAANDAANHLGGNDLMNVPVLSAAYSSASGTTVSGTLDLNTVGGPFAAGTQITVDFYANTSPDPSGYGQGQTWLGSYTVVANGTATENFAAMGLAALPTGEGWVSATATDNAGNTSEFAANVKGAPIVHVAANLSAAASADTANLTLTASDLTPADQSGSFSYSVNWGDGNITPLSGSGSGTAASHAYTQDGTYTVTVTATDTDDAVSPAATALVVVSTRAQDTILVNGGSSAGQVAVTEGGTTTTVSPTDLVLVAGQAGADWFTVNVSSTLTVPVSVVGGGTTAGDTLTVNGPVTNSSSTVSKTSGLINWVSPVAETIAYTAVQNVTIASDSTTTNYFLDPGSQDTTLVGGPGSNTFVINSAVGNGVVIQGGPASNTYIVNLGSLAGPVTVNNSSPSASNSLTVNGAPGNNTITASGNQVTSSGQTININVLLASATINGGSGNNQITVANLSVPVQSLALNGGGGNNDFTLVNVSTSVANLAVTGSTTGTNEVQVTGSLPATVLPQDITPTVTVTDAGGNYNGLPFTATATVTGVSANATASLEGVTPSVTYYAGSAATGTPLAGAPANAGTYTVVASFAGSADYTSATSTAFTFTISKAMPTVAVTDAGGTYTGNPFPATATVKGISGSPGTTLENVGLTFTYYVGSGTSGTNLGSTAPSSAGTYTVVAAFAGSTDYSAASAQAAFTIGQRTTNLSSLSAPGNPYFGQALTFTATVTGSAGSPTGSVDFYDTTTAVDLGSITLSGGTASLTSATLPPGSNQITATYGGSGNFLGSNNSVTVSILQSIYVMNATAAGALTLSGNGQLQIGGILDVDSSSSSAVSASGNAVVSAGSIKVVGGVSSSGNAHFTPTPVTHASTFTDPLATVLATAPSVGGSATTVNLSGNSSQTINPGRFSQITVSGNGKLTLNPGIYVITGGGFSVTGNGTVSGSGVFLYNAGSNYPSAGGTFGGVNLSGNGNISLSPMTTGTYAGILLDQPSANTSALALAGNAITIPGGVIYAPAAALTMSGNGQFKGSFIVSTINVSGNGILNQLSSAGATVYTPAQIRTAYGINSLSLDGTGQTIAIVDAYDDPDIGQALDTFDTQFGLTSSGASLYQLYGPAASFLTVLNQQGQSGNLPATDPSGPGTSNWEMEETLDVEWAHAIAPGPKIIVVEADSQSLADLMASAVTAANQPGVSVVSMSWGFAEGQAVFAQDEALYDQDLTTPAGHQGVTFVASTGDYGTADPEYPAFSPNVVAVGGTSLYLNADDSYQSETGFGYNVGGTGTFIGSGGGISLYEPEPAYQQSVQSTGYRTTPDVALVADPNTGAWIADPYNLPGSDPWAIVGGTSLSAPCWAGLISLADQARVQAGDATLGTASPTETQEALYNLPVSDFHDITSGSNGYSAGTGYDLVTGLGTPVANLLVPALAAYNRAVNAQRSVTVTGAGVPGGNNSAGGTFNVINVFNAVMVAAPGLGVESKGVGLSAASTLAASLEVGNHSASSSLQNESQAPEAGQFTASPNPVMAGGNVTLTATNISGGTANVTQVAFYVTNSGSNMLLGYGIQTSPGVWTLSCTVNLAPGTYKVFAQAEVSVDPGDLFATTLWVLHPAWDH